MGDGISVRFSRFRKTTSVEMTDMTWEYIQLLDHPPANPPAIPQALDLVYHHLHSLERKPSTEEV
jgi:hypothetical protein